MRFVATVLGAAALMTASVVCLLWGSSLWGSQVVMALRVRPQHFPVHCDIDTRQIMRTSKMVASYTGISVQPNKAIVGANAFAHESGIHQHGMLKNASTYEIMTPESVGIEGGHAGRGSLVLGKHSGKAAYRQRLIELG